MAWRARNSRRGATLIEAAVGLTFLIPVVLFLIDICSLALAQTSNDSLAKHAARIAATQATQQARQTSAQLVVNSFKKTALIDSANLVEYTEPQAGQTVQVKTQIVCHLPVALPFMGLATQPFQAVAVEPVTAVRAASATVNSTPLSGASGANDTYDKGFLKLTQPLPTGVTANLRNDPSAELLPQ